MVGRDNRVLVPALLAVLLTGCASPSHRGAAPAAGPSAPGQPSASAGGPGPSPTPTGASSSAAPAGPRTCRSSQLTARLEPGSPGAGQRYATIVLTNHGAATCLLYGYGGMQLLDAARHPLPTKMHRVALPAPRRIEFRPGASASSQLHWTVVPGTGDSTGPACQPAPAFAEITPPDQRDFLVVAWSMGSVCQRGSIDQAAYV